MQVINNTNVSILSIAKFYLRLYFIPTCHRYSSVTRVPYNFKLLKWCFLFDYLLSDWWYIHRFPWWCSWWSSHHVLQIYKEHTRFWFQRWKWRLVTGLDPFLFSLFIWLLVFPLLNFHLNRKQFDWFLCVRCTLSIFGLKRMNNHLCVISYITGRWASNEPPSLYMFINCSTRELATIEKYVVWSLPC